MESEKSFDVIIVGAGTSGIPCALTAADSGLRVLLVEKSDHVGGTLSVSGGHMSAAGTTPQARSGIVNDTPDAHFDDIVRISENTMRADIARLAVDLAPEMIDWLDAEGFDWHPSTPRIVFGHEPYEVARTYYGADEGRTMLAFLAAKLDQRVATGSVVLRLGTAMKSLIVADVGGVETVVGVRLGGDVGLDGGPDGGSTGENCEYAKSVVLATGGFSSNPTLFAELEGAPLVSAGVPTSTGDGLMAARDVGAGLAGQGTYIPTFGGMPHPDDPGRVQWVDRPHLSAAERDPWEIYVDRSGRRFINEADHSIDRKERALVHVPEMAFWMIFDDRAVHESADIVHGWTADGFRERANVRNGVVSAQTIEELAEKAGIDVEGLQLTVRGYNDSIRSGAKDELGRTVRPACIETAPFYALKNHAITLITFTGVDVSSELQVRRSDGTIIPGLYALGELLGSGAYMGNSFCSGMLVGPCISFGRWLGSQLGTEFARNLAS